jgi:hypothetical protein
MVRQKKYAHVQAAQQRRESCDRACSDYSAQTDKHCDYGPATGKSYMSVKKKCDYYHNKEVKCLRGCLRRRGGSGRKFKA